MAYATPGSAFISQPIVLRSRLWLFILLAFSLILQAIYTWWFFGMWSVLPDQKVMLLGGGLMAGASALLIVQIIALAVRRVIATENGITVRLLFTPSRTIGWEQVETQRVETWDWGSRTNTRVILKIDEITLRLESRTWTKVDALAAHILAKTKTKPVQGQSPSSAVLSDVALTCGIILALTIFSVADTPLLRDVGFFVVRLLWAVYILKRPAYEQPLMRYYVVLVSCIALCSLAIADSSDFGQMITWWLYSPLLDVVVTYIVTEIWKRWKASLSKTPAAKMPL